MSTFEPQELTNVLETVKQWPPPIRVSLARMILETIELPDISALESKKQCPERRGKPVESLIGLGAGSGPPPSDQIVRQWIDEHRFEKYGR